MVGRSYCKRRDVLLRHCLSLSLSLFLFQLLCHLRERISSSKTQFELFQDQIRMHVMHHGRPCRDLGVQRDHRLGKG